MPRANSSRETRALLVLAVLVIGLGAVAGSIYGLSTTQWLVLALSTSLVVWVGGAISGQVILARLLDKGRSEQVLDFTRVLLLIIPVFYVPVSLVALGCGVALIAIHGVAFWSPQVVIPLALYLMASVAGGAISAPGYTRLIRFAEANGPEHPDVRRRLVPLAWLNRIELSLVVGLGFTSLIAAIG